MKTLIKRLYGWGRRNMETIIVTLVLTFLFLGMIFLSKG